MIFSPSPRTGCFNIDTRIKMRFAANVSKTRSKRREVFNGLERTLLQEVVLRADSSWFSPESELLDVPNIYAFLHANNGCVSQLMVPKTCSKRPQVFNGLERNLFQDLVLRADSSGFSSDFGLFLMIIECLKRCANNKFCVSSQMSI